MGPRMPWQFTVQVLQGLCAGAAQAAPAFAFAPGIMKSFHVHSGVCSAW